MKYFSHLASCLLSLSALVSTTVSAQNTFPSQPISIIVPYSPGGTSDITARIIAKHLGTKLNTSVVVQNKSGASGTIGERAVIQSKADGYTLLYDATPLSINPFVQTLTFDPFNDLKPISLVSITPMLLVTSKESNVESLDNLIKVAKQAPGKLTFSSGGLSTVQYMGAQLLFNSLGVDLLHVPYKSGAPAIMAAISKESDVAFGNLPAVKPLLESGKGKALAISASERHSLFPNIPTVAEASTLKDYAVYEWNGILAPKNTPDEIIKTLEKTIQEVLHDPAVKEQIEGLGSKVVGSTSQEFSTFLKNEAEKWKKTVSK